MHDYWALLTPNSHQKAKFSQRTYVRYLALSLLQNPHHPSFSRRPLLVLLTPPLLPNLCTNIFPIFFLLGITVVPPRRIKDNGYAIFLVGWGGGEGEGGLREGGVNKVHCGLCENGEFFLSLVLLMTQRSLFGEENLKPSLMSMYTHPILCQL